MSSFLNPFTWLRAFWQFVGSWFLSLPWNNSVKTLPAIFLMLLIGVAGFIASNKSNWRSEWLNKQLQVAVESNHYATAELVVKRQLGYQPDDKELLFRLASLKEAQEAHEEALRLMRILVGYQQHVGAAKWLLQHEYIGKNWHQLDFKQQEEFGAILKLLTKEEPDNMMFKQLYADYLIACQKFPQAIPVLNDLARAQPMRGLQAAALARQMGNQAIAKRYAEQALETVAKLSIEDPTNSILALAVAQNQLFLKRYGEAVRTLERAVKRAKIPEDQQKLSLAMGDAIVAWVGFIEESPQHSDKDRQRVLRMLQVALKYAPNNPRVLTLVADQVLATMDEKDEQTRALRNALVSGTSPGIAHFIRGTAALMKGDLQRAEQSLQLAEKELPRSGAILNNLAVAMSMTDEPKLELALKMSNKAIELTPGASPHFYETRGQILVRLERHTDAIADLEKALSVKSLASKAHEALAICYEKIGDSELAEAHREAIQEKTGVENADEEKLDEKKAED